MGRAPWAILDFAGPDGLPRREVFQDPVAVIEATQLSEVVECLRQAEGLAMAGSHVVGFVAYDAAPAFEAAFAVRQGYRGPLAWFAAFRPPTDDAPELRRGQAMTGVESEGAEAWAPRFDAGGYTAAVEAILEGTRRGDFYQVNFTDRFSAKIDDPVNVYERVRAAQQAGYAALLDTGEMVVISVSPELFVRKTGTTLESRPMKGTAPRGRWSAEDDELAERLAGSEKERAENVMIVDLIRNDMGRIAVPGSVEVPSMFTVERYPTVLQMTSHIKSQIPAAASLIDVYLALFPCGSITGAPKIAASKAIAALETEPRGIYCGAIGVVRPGGDFVFNVAIRTIVVDAHGNAIYGAGGGITADSNPGQELNELRTKAAVLTAPPRANGLIETLRLQEGRLVRLDRHLRRLAASARYFGFDRREAGLEDVRSGLAAEAGRHPSGRFRVRVVLDRTGSHAITVEPHGPDEPRRTLAVSPLRIDSRDPLLFHKTTRREVYAKRLEGLGTDDAILVNEQGELTETVIGNLVLELDGRLVTPPLECGLLPGVFREELLEQGRIAEQVLHPADLDRSRKVWTVNSLREWMPCDLR